MSQGHRKRADQQKFVAPPGGLEPPTFRLTAERASQLRHGGILYNELVNSKQFIDVESVVGALFTHLNKNMCIEHKKEMF